MKIKVIITPFIIVTVITIAIIIIIATLPRFKMAEAALVARTEFPITTDRLAAQLAGVGLAQGDIVLVHS